MPEELTKRGLVLADRARCSTSTFMPDTQKGLSKESAVRIRQDFELFNHSRNQYCKRKFAKGLRGKLTYSVSKLDYYADMVINGKCSPFRLPQPHTPETENP